ncbi:MAG: hypothetical protein ACI865_003122 [Flavobacteriaceae bacterium]|jgi:hypothetical protein
MNRIFGMKINPKEIVMTATGKITKPEFEVEGKYFETHMTEARSVNRLRKKMYSKLTNGRSEVVSKTFIRNQYFAIPIAKFTDLLGRKFQKAGIPIIELDLVSMHEIEDFSASFATKAQPIELFKPINAWGIRKSLKRAFKTGGFNAVATLAQKEIDSISSIHTYHAMTRHMLESIVRMAKMADIYIQMAKEKKTKSTRALSRFMLTLHINALIGCRKLDVLAAPIQADGVPIIHQDVPAISPLPHNLSSLIN